MHRYFADEFNGLEFGARSTTYAMTEVAPPPRTRPVTGADGKTTQVPVTPKDEVAEAIKDGKVNSAEKTVFQREDTKQVVKDEQDRLRDAVKQAGGDPKAKPSASQRYAVESKEQKAHRERVEELGENKESGNLEALDAQAKELEGRGHTAAAASVKAEREQRAAEEQKVLDVVEDREALVGTLEAEKVALEAGNADYELEEINAQAQALVDQFNANGGQYYEGNDLFGDDWDTAEVSFEQLADRFRDKPELMKDFVSSQGINDGDLRGKDEAEVFERINDYDKASDRTEVRNRYVAAQELVPLIEKYNELRETSEGGSARITEIDAEIGSLTAANEADLQVLSQETLDAHAAANEEVAGIIPEAPAEEPASDGTAPTDGTTPSGDASDPASDVTGDQPSTTDAGAGEQTPGADAAGDAAPAAPAAIDYSAPERREQVLQAAQQASLLPAQNTTFNDAGEAVYTVQPGDSYWRISDMSDGRPPNEFDNQHFLANVSANSERLGRDPRAGLIHPNEQVVIQNRSIADLVALLQLPTVEELEPVG